MRKFRWIPGPSISYHLLFRRKVGAFRLTQITAEPGDQGTESACR